MAYDPHNLKLAVLRGSVLVMHRSEACIRSSHLEALVLEDALDRRIFSIWRELCLEHNPKRPVSHDLTLGVLHLFCFTSKAVLDFLADHLCQNLSDGAYCVSVLWY